MCCCRRRARLRRDAGNGDSTTRQKFRKKLREGELDDKEIEIEVAEAAPQMEIIAPPGMEELTAQIQGMFASLGGGRRKPRKLKIREAMKLLTEEEAAQAGQRGRDSRRGARQRRAERHRVPRRDRQDRQPRARAQRRRRLAPGRAARPAAAGRGHDGVDQVRHGARPTTSCSSPRGAFHLAKPSDLIPELQGRFPIRVELRVAVGGRFRAHPHRHRRVPDQAVPGAARHRRREARVHARRRHALAEIAFQVNERTENIGARRLYTVMERLLEEVTFEPPRLEGQTVRIDAAYVDAAWRHKPQRGPVALHP